VRFEVVAPARFTVTDCDCSICTKSVCGIKSFYVPRSHPDGYSVNARCLDEGTVEEMTIVPSDGKNWEKTHAAP
jgi:hypothetical protein